MKRADGYSHLLAHLFNVAAKQMAEQRQQHLRKAKYFVYPKDVMWLHCFLVPRAAYCSAADDIDRAAFLSITGQAFERFDAHAWA